MLSFWRLLPILALLAALLQLGAIASASVQPPLIDADQTVDTRVPTYCDFPVIRLQRPSRLIGLSCDTRTSGHEFSNAAVIEFDETSTVETEYSVDAQIDYIEPGRRHHVLLDPGK